MTREHFTKLELEDAQALYRLMKGTVTEVTIEGRSYTRDEICRNLFSKAFAEGTADAQELCRLSCWLAWQARADAAPQPLNPVVCEATR